MKNLKLLSLIALAVSILASCQKDPPDFKAYFAANGTGTATGGGTTTSTGGGSTANASDYYFKGTLNGAAFDWQVTDNVNGWIYVAAAITTVDTGVTTGNIQAVIENATANAVPQLNLTFETISLNSGQNQSTYIKSFLATGAWVVDSTLFMPATVKAILVNYTDAQGNAYWSVGAQAGSNAKLVAVTSVAASGHTKSGFKVKLTFNCNLYPVLGTGNTIVLSNAEATVFLGDSL